MPATNVHCVGEQLLCSSVVVWLALLSWFHPAFFNFVQVKDVKLELDGIVHLSLSPFCVHTWQQHDFMLQRYLFSDLPFSASVTSVAVFSVITRKTAPGNLATRCNRDPLPAA